MTGAPASPERPRLATLGAARADARFADAERHRRRVKRLKIALPLLSVFYPMIALVTLLAGGYRRSGFGRRVVVAIGVAALLQVVMFTARARVHDRIELVPLMYLPTLLAIVYIGVLLARLMRERRPACAPGATTPVAPA